MTPWLVRTHFGDLAMLIKEKYGSNRLDQAIDDILQVGNFKPESPILADGVVDYLKLPEMAEMSGLVFPRNPALYALPGEAAEDMPTNIGNLLNLAEKMLRHQDEIKKRLLRRRCSLHGITDIDARNLTVRAWLDGLQNGKDLMSDHDSLTRLPSALRSGRRPRTRLSTRVQPCSQREVALLPYLFKDDR